MLEFIILVFLFIAIWFLFGIYGLFDDMIEQSIKSAKSKKTKVPLPFKIIIWVRSWGE